MAGVPKDPNQYFADDRQLGCGFDSPHLHDVWKAFPQVSEGVTRRDGARLREKGAAEQAHVSSCGFRTSKLLTVRDGLARMGRNSVPGEAFVRFRPAPCKTLWNLAADSHWPTTYWRCGSVPSSGKALGKSAASGWSAVFCQTSPVDLPTGALQQRRALTFLLLLPGEGRIDQ